ncbi:hypothetical protein D3C75_1120130 [compost metagenome]
MFKLDHAGVQMPLLKCTIREMFALDAHLLQMGRAYRAYRKFAAANTAVRQQLCAADLIRQMLKLDHAGVQMTFRKRTIRKMFALYALLLQVHRTY